SCRSSVVLQLQGWGKQPDLTGNPSMTTQPLARYGPPNGALANGFTTSVTPRPGTRPGYQPVRYRRKALLALLSQLLKRQRSAVHPRTEEINQDPCRHGQMAPGNI